MQGSGDSEGKLLLFFVAWLLYRHLTWLPKARLKGSEKSSTGTAEETVEHRSRKMEQRNASRSIKSKKQARRSNRIKQDRSRNKKSRGRP